MRIFSFRRFWAIPQMVVRILGGVAFLVSMPAMSAEPGWWMSAQAGAAFAQRTDNKHTYTMPQVTSPDDYHTKDRTEGYVMGVSAGYQFVNKIARTKHFFSWLPATRVGLGYAYVASTDVQGVVVKYQETTAFDYEYAVRAQVLWVEGQLDIFRWGRFTPFVDVAMGTAFNRASGYEESPTAGNQQRLNPDFATETSTNFAWRVGMGVNYTLPQGNNAWVVGLLARYSDLGEVETGRSHTYPTVGRLNTVLANTELLLALRYHF